MVVVVWEVWAVVWEAWGKGWSLVSVLEVRIWDYIVAGNTGGHSCLSRDVVSRDLEYGNLEPERVRQLYAGISNFAPEKDAGNAMNLLVLNHPPVENHM